MKIVLKVFLFFIGLSCISLQAGTPIIDHYSYTDYQAGGENWDVAEDDMGIMYFANEKGILKYNGEKWDLIFNDEYTIVRSLAKSKKNRIYVGSDNGIGYLEIRANNTVEYISLKEKLNDEASFLRDVWKVVVLEDKVFFQSTNRVFVYSESTETFERIFKTNVFVRGMYLVGNDIFLADKDRGLLIYQKGELLPLPKGGFLAGKEVNAILPFSDGKLLIFTYKDGLLVYDGQNFNKWEIPLAEKVRKSYVFCSIKMQQNFVLGTTENGIFIFNEKGELKEHFNEFSGLKDNKVFNLYLDQNQNLWSCFELGIDHISMNLPFRVIGQHLGVPGTGKQAAVLRDSIFFCTTKGVYYGRYRDPFGKNHKNISYRNYRGIIGPAYYITKWHNKELIGHLLGIKCVTANGVSDLSSLNHSLTYYKLGDDPNRMLATFDGGVQLIKAEKDSFFIEKTYDELKGIEHIALDADGFFWMSGKYGGVHRVRLSSDYVLSYHKVYGKKEGLPSDYQNIVFKFKEEVLIGTVDGIYRFGRNTLSADKRFQDLIGTVVTHVTNDGENLLVQAGVQQGNHDKRLFQFYVYDIRTLEQNSRFLALKRFKGEEFDAIDKLNDSLYVISGKEVSYYFKAKEVKDNVSSGKIHFENIWVHSRDNHKHLFFSHDSTFTSEEVENKFSNSNIDFAFNSISFEVYNSFYLDAEKNEYSYYLKGFDEDWTQWTNNNTRSFENLDPGNYEFHVKSRNVFGYRSLEGVFKFRIVPPWYETWWFYSLEVAILLSLIYASYYFSTSKKTSKYSIFLVIFTTITVIEIIAELFENYLRGMGVSIFIITLLLNVVLASILGIAEHRVRVYFDRKVKKDQEEDYKDMLSGIK